MLMRERERERTATQTLVETAIAGSGGLLVVEGPLGIGKSALLMHVARRADAAGMAVRLVHATRLGAEIPFALARWLLDPLVRARPSVLTAGWARHARVLFEGEASSDGDRRMLVEGLVTLVAELRRSGPPLALMVDDAHWIDSASLEFLEELARRCEDIGVALAITVETSHSAPDGSLARLAAAAGPRLLQPAPLTTGAVRELVSERLPDADRGFAARVAEATGGNPSLVCDLLASAERHGTTAPLVPDALGRASLLRIQDAGPSARALAEAVAVLGEAPLRLAAALARLQGRIADRAADDLAALHVLAAGEPVRFAQPLVGEALATTIAPFERAAYHRRAAQLIADEGGDRDRIAGHLLRTRPSDDPWVCEVLRQAARTAVARGEPAAAAHLLERAYAEPAVAQDRGAVLLELASARAAAGRPEAMETFERALTIEDDSARRADAWERLSRLLYAQGDFAGAADAGARGRAELPVGDPHAERLLAVELTAASTFPALAGEAIARLDALAEGVPPTEPTLLALLCPHQAARVIAIDRVAEFARRAVATDPLVHPESHGIPLTYVAGALNFIDECVLAEELLDRGLARAIELGDPLAEINLRATRAWARIFRGRLKLAAEDLDAVLAVGELGWQSIDAQLATPLIALRLELGDLDGAREALRRAPAAAQIGHAWYDGAVALADNDPATALSAFEAAGAELEDMLGVVNPGVRPWRSSAALAAMQLGEIDQAQSLAAAEVEQARAAKGPRALGIALRVAGLVGDGAELLEESVTVLERSSARLELARSLMYAGIARRRAGDAVPARSTLARALELALDCGASALAERASTELRIAGARPRRRPRTGVEALTPNERQTAELAAAGRTTKQIAATLYLSPKTVEARLTSAFRKLSISSRAELGPRLAQWGETPRRA